jgi:transcription elongation factor Elf1
MPLTGPIPEGHSFFCPSCGALYAVTYSRPLSGDSNNTATCVVCERIMATSSSTDVPTFKLVHRPEDA